MNLYKCISLIVLVLLVGVTPLLAQDAVLPGEVIVSDLGAPRGLAFAEDGTLLIVDAGLGGGQELMLQGPEGFGAVQAGLTGKIVAVGADGAVSEYLGGFPSYAAPSETTGLYRAIPQGDSLWLVVNGNGPAATGAFWNDSVVELDTETLVVRNIINFNNFEAVNDPDGLGYDSNVTDIAWDADGTLYIINAGMNALLTWTEADGLQLVNAWGDNAVPDSIEIADNGDLYIGFLGTGLAPGAAKIEHWSGGEVVETFGGLTAVTDILLTENALYAVQMMIFGEQGPGAGNVVAVTAEGNTPVAEGLIAPFGLAEGPDGALYVSYGTIALVPDVVGGVLRIDAGA